jgi:ribosome-associated heat shock protein Hsp15
MGRLPGESVTSTSETPLSVRLDVWLDVACLFPTRSQAKAACDGGKVEVNGSRGKPHREIRVGDRLTVTRGPGVRSEIIVRGLAGRSIRKAEARKLYEDVTPAPAPEVIEARRWDRMMAGTRSEQRPDKRERREIRKRKGW